MAMKYCSLGFAVLVCLFTLSCGTYIKVTPLGSLTYPPTRTCEVFTAKVPDRPFTELALIEVYQGGKTIEIAKKRAMQMGADAIFMKGVEAYGSVPVTSGITGTANKTIFVAIKWKERADK
jgi:hypothetical protein